MPRGTPKTRRAAASADDTDAPAAKRSPQEESYPQNQAAVPGLCETDDAASDPGSVASIAETKVTSARVVSLSELYRQLATKFPVNEEDRCLCFTGDDRRALCDYILTEYFGGITVVKPRQAPTQLHAAYFKKTVVIVVSEFGSLDPTDDATYEAAPLLSLGRDKDTKADLPVKDRMRLILSGREWKDAHLLHLLSVLDYFVTDYCANLVRTELYAGSGVRVPTRKQLAQRWTKGTLAGDAPMRHFVDAYTAKDEQGNLTDEINITLDFSIRAKDTPTSAIVVETATSVRTAPCTEPGLLGRGDRVIPAVVLRGINLLPDNQRIGPNVRAVCLWAKCKPPTGAEADALVDFSDIVQM
jgi:hypothetical protein